MPFHLGSEGSRRIALALPGWSDQRIPQRLALLRRRIDPYEALSPSPDVVRDLGRVAVELRHDAQQSLLIRDSEVSEDHGSAVRGDDMEPPTVPIPEIHQRAHADRLAPAALEVARLVRC